MRQPAPAMRDVCRRAVRTLKICCVRRERWPSAVVSVVPGLRRTIFLAGTSNEFSIAAHETPIIEIGRAG